MTEFSNTNVLGEMDVSFDPSAFGITSAHDCMDIACEPFSTCAAISYREDECAVYSSCALDSLVDAEAFVTIFGNFVL